MATPPGVIDAPEHTPDGPTKKSFAMFNESNTDEVEASESNADEVEASHPEPVKCTRRGPFYFTPMAVNSISPAHLHVRPMGVHCTCR